MLRLSQRGNKGATPLSPDPAPRAHEAPVSGASSNPEAKITALGELILQRLDDDKAQDVVFIDLKGKSAVADALIVASGRSHRHVGAMADHLLRALKEEGLGKARQVAVITGETAQAEREQVQAAGFMLLYKPVPAAQLRAAIGRAAASPPSLP